MQLRNVTITQSSRDVGPVTAFVTLITFNATVRTGDIHVWIMGHKTGYVTMMTMDYVMITYMIMVITVAVTVLIMATAGTATILTTVITGIITIMPMATIGTVFIMAMTTNADTIGDGLRRYRHSVGTITIMDTTDSVTIMTMVTTMLLMTFTPRFEVVIATNDIAYVIAMYIVTLAGITGETYITIVAIMDHTMLMHRTISPWPYVGGCALIPRRGASA